jgi:hypothetical protein
MLAVDDYCTGTCTGTSTELLVMVGSGRCRFSSIIVVGLRFESWAMMDGAPTRTHVL